MGGRVDKYWKRRGYKENWKRLGITPLPPEDLTVTNEAEAVAKFKLKGFEFGNWVNMSQRNDFMTATVISLFHLNKILKFGNNIGLDRTVGIAFGARGFTRAAAHFEPWTNMINLTKEHGTGSLAHEYGHALDFVFGTFVERSTAGRALTNGGTSPMREAAGQIISLLVKKSDGNPTAYWVGLKKRFNNPYWFRREELFARAFEVYIHYKLQLAGIKNRFLAHEKYEHEAYIPVSEFVRQGLPPVWDKLIRLMAQKARK